MADELPREGTYSGLYGWSLSSDVHQLEDGHVLTHDTYRGTFFNDAGGGFLHESSWVCFGTSDLHGGAGDSGGYCVITDGDDDKAFLRFQGTVDPATGFNGDYQWTGGTGKYTGIGGENAFSARIVGGAEGRGILRGEWRLP